MSLCSGVCKGRSGSHLIGPVTREIAALAFATGSRFVARWIPSELNISDGPSRGRRPDGSPWNEDPFDLCFSSDSGQAPGLSLPSDIEPCLADDTTSIHNADHDAVDAAMSTSLPSWNGQSSFCRSANQVDLPGVSLYPASYFEQLSKNDDRVCCLVQKVSDGLERCRRVGHGHHSLLRSSFLGWRRCCRRQQSLGCGQVLHAGLQPPWRGSPPQIPQRYPILESTLAGVPASSSSMAGGVCNDWLPILYQRDYRCPHALDSVQDLHAPWRPRPIEGEAACWSHWRCWSPVLGFQIFPCRGFDPWQDWYLRRCYSVRYRSPSDHRVLYDPHVFAEPRCSSLADGDLSSVGHLLPVHHSSQSGISQHMPILPAPRGCLGRHRDFSPHSSGGEKERRLEVRPQPPPIRKRGQSSQQAQESESACAVSRKNGFRKPATDTPAQDACGCSSSHVKQYSPLKRPRRPVL